MTNKEIIPEIIIDDFESLFKVFYDYIYIPDRDFLNHGIDYNPIIKNHKTIIFRGHKEEGYKLESTLERHIKGIFPDLNKELFRQISNEYLEDCKKELKGKISEQYILNSINDVWALGQHYGLKTPLLDWTRSFIIALFFAFEEQVSDSDYRVVYALDYFFPIEGMDIIEPEFPIGSRIIAQKGVFTNMFSSELENINSYFSNGDYIEEGKNLRPLKKYKIRSSLRDDIMNFLSSLNIDCYTIYPDIQGAIKNSHIQLDNIINLIKEIGIQGE